MRYFRFKTFTTSYYYPNLSKDKEYMYGLYSAYGGKLSKIYWYLFKRFYFIRFLTSINEKELPFPYDTIKNCLGKNTILSFNMGSPGVEQKISILGYDKDNGIPFFAKFSQKEAAKLLTRNEIKVYKLLNKTNLTPRLLEYKITDDYVCMKAEYVKGKRPDTRTINSEVIKLSLIMKDFRLYEETDKKNDLVYCLSHGDFCPWNILVNNGNYRLIDWELANDRPLGYDIFTYICQVALLFDPNSDLLKVLDSNKDFIKEYFNSCGIVDYIPYIKAFAIEKSAYEKEKGNQSMCDKYLKLNSKL